MSIKKIANIIREQKTAWKRVGETTRKWTTQEEFIAQAILAEIEKKVNEEMTGHCDSPIISPREYVTHEMALDAGDKDLEGQIYKEETAERCGGCVSCIKDQVLSTIKSKLREL